MESELLTTAGLVETVLAEAQALGFIDGEPTREAKTLASKYAEKLLDATNEVASESKKKQLTEICKVRRDCLRNAEGLARNDLPLVGVDLAGKDLSTSLYPVVFFALLKKEAPEILEEMKVAIRDYSNINRLNRRAIERVIRESTGDVYGDVWKNSSDAVAVKRIGEILFEGEAGMMQRWAVMFLQPKLVEQKPKIKMPDVEMPQAKIPQLPLSERVLSLESLVLSPEETYENLMEALGSGFSHERLEAEAPQLGLLSFKDCQGTAAEYMASHNRVLNINKGKREMAYFDTRHLAGRYGYAKALMTSGETNYLESLRSLRHHLPIKLEEAVNKIIKGAFARLEVTDDFMKKFSEKVANVPFNVTDLGGESLPDKIQILIRLTAGLFAQNGGFPKEIEIALKKQALELENEKRRSSVEVELTKTD